MSGPVAPQPAVRPTRRLSASSTSCSTSFSPANNLGLHETMKLPLGLLVMALAAVADLADAVGSVAAVDSASLRGSTHAPHRTDLILLLSSPLTPAFEPPYTPSVYCEEKMWVRAVCRARECRLFACRENIGPPADVEPLVLTTPVLCCPPRNRSGATTLIGRAIRRGTSRCRSSTVRAAVVAAPSATQASDWCA